MVYSVVYFSRYSFENALIEDAVTRKHLAVLKSTARFLKPEDFKKPLAAPVQRRLNSFAQDLAASEAVRLVIWSADHQIVFSDLKEAIGLNAPERAELSTVLKGGQPLSSRRAEDIQLPRLSSGSDFLDIYIPLRPAEETIGAVELHIPTETVFAPAQKQIQYVTAVLILSGTMMFILIFFISKNLVGANQQLKRREQVQKLLKELSQDITFLDLDNLLRKMLEKLKVALSVDIVDVRMLEQNEWRQIGVAGDSVDALKKDLSGLLLVHAQWIFKNRQSLLIEDISQTTNREKEAPLDRMGIKGYAGVPLFSRQGEVIGILRVLSYTPRDLTNDQDMLEQMASGIAIALETSQLYDRSREQAAKLEAANVTLTAQAAELKRSNQELEQFAYVASHDLQEPLRMITSYTNLLARRYAPQLDSDASEFMNFAIDGAKRMQVLINDLLTYSRVGTKGKALVTIDTDSVLEKTLTVLQVAIAETGAEVTHDKLPPIQGDDVQIGQLLQNLIGNALKYRNENAPRVHISCREEGENWLFSVQDNGIGIDPKFADKIFVIFQRLHTKEAYPGTGIGLAVCKKIVERHGGTIWVKSEPGAGSTFYFTVPTGSVAVTRRAPTEPEFEQAQAL